MEKASSYSERGSILQLSGGGSCLYLVLTLWIFFLLFAFPQPFQLMTYFLLAYSHIILLDYLWYMYL